MSDKAKHKRELRLRRHNRVRRKVYGTAERPRLAVHRSNRHITAQLIDDEQGRTIAAASSVEPDLRSDATGNVASATRIGERIGERAKAAGVDTVVFDRGGYRYHGRVAAVADAAREAGLKF